TGNGASRSSAHTFSRWATKRRTTFLWKEDCRNRWNEIAFSANRNDHLWRHALSRRANRRVWQSSPMNIPLVVWLVLCLIWGSTWFFIKLGLRDLPPFTFAGLRFLLASVILWSIVFARRRPLPKTGSDWLKLAWAGGISFALNYGLIFWGEQYINSGLAAVLQSMIPVFGLIFAHYYLPNERVTTRKLAGVAIGVAGVSLIFYDQVKIEGAAALEGSAALVLSSVCVAYT